MKRVSGRALGRIDRGYRSGVLIGHIDRIREPDARTKAREKTLAGRSAEHRRIEHRRFEYRHEAQTMASEKYPEDGFSCC